MRGNLAAGFHDYGVLWTLVLCQKERKQHDDEAKDDGNCSRSLDDSPVQMTSKELPRGNWRLIGAIPAYE
jgi:hypothetical protein